MTELNDSESYVRKVSEDTARYTREVLRENQKLRALAAKLEAERKRLEDDLHHQLEVHERDRSDLEQQLEQLETESRKYLEDYLEVEQQNTNLANLYVASYRLHSTLERGEVLAGIQEIIINLIGSEDLAVFEISGAEEMLRLAAAVGDQARAFPDLPDPVRSRIRESIRSGEIWIRENGEAFPLTACIPLQVDGEVTGAIVIFRLLQQKTAVEPVDRELFALLATHAATALYCTSLHATRRAAVEVA